MNGKKSKFCLLKVAIVGDRRLRLRPQAKFWGTRPPFPAPIIAAHADV